MPNYKEGVAIGQTHVDITVLGEVTRGFIYVTENPVIEIEDEG